MTYSTNDSTASNNNAANDKSNIFRTNDTSKTGNLSNKHSDKHDKDNKNTVISVDSAADSIKINKSTKSTSTRHVHKVKHAVPMSFENQLFEKELKKNATNAVPSIVSEREIHEEDVDNPPPEPSCWDALPEHFRDKPATVITTILTKLVDGIPREKSNFLGMGGNEKEITQMKKFIANINKEVGLNDSLKKHIEKRMEAFSKVDKENTIALLEGLQDINNDNIGNFISLLLPFIQVSNINLGANIPPTNYKALQLLNATIIKGAMSFPFVESFIKDQLKSSQDMNPKLQKFLVENFDSIYSITKYAVPTLLAEPEIKRQIDETVKKYDHSDLHDLHKDIDKQTKIHEQKKAKLTELTDRNGKIEIRMGVVQRINPSSEEIGTLKSQWKNNNANIRTIDNEIVEIEKNIHNKTSTIKHKESEIVENLILHTGENLSSNKKSIIVSCIKSFVETPTENIL